MTIVKLSEPAVLTVEDVRRFALPLETTLVAGASASQRPVRWAVAATPGAPLPFLEGGEVVIIANSEGNLDAILHACSQGEAAAVACAGPIPPVALATAEMLNLPVLHLPRESHLRDIERSVLNLILNRHGHFERLNAQIGQQLMRVASENSGLDKIVHMLGRYVNKGVIVQDKYLRVKYHATTPQLAAIWSSVLEMIGDKQWLPEAFHDRHRLPQFGTGAARQQLGPDGPPRLVVPIINQSVGRGFLSLIAPPGERFDDVDTMVITHGAVVCALEMARAKAISEVEKKLRGDFITNLMAGTVGEAESQAEGERFNHDMNAPHVALVIMLYGDKRPSDRRLETLVNGLVSGREIQALLQQREKELRVFLAIVAADPIPAARQFAEDILKEARREFKSARLAIGIGTVAGRTWEWQGSYREALRAADIAQRLQSDVPLYAGDLYIYSFLARPDFRDDLRTLRDQMIGDLLKYEERQRADLLQTLEAFFQCHGNHNQTAAMLSVHRNTLFYRMNRIADITGLDLNQPDVRLAVHLALKIHRLLSVESQG